MDPRLHPDDPFTDPELRARATVSLRTIVRIVAVALVLIVALQLFRGDPLAAILPVVLMALLAPWLLVPLRSQRIREAALGLALLLLLGAIANLTGFGSVRGAGLIGVFAALALAGVYLETRTLAALFVASCALLGLLIVAESRGAIRPATVATGIGHWIALVLALGSLAAGISQVRILMSGTVRALRRENAQRESAEGAMRENEALLASMLRSVPTGIVVSDQESCTLMAVNEAHERLFGRLRDQVVGRTHTELGTWAQEGDRLRFAETMRTAGRVKDYPGRFRHADGSEFEALITSEVVELGGRKCVVTSFTDMRETIVARERLKRSEELFARTFHASPIANVITRVGDGAVLDRNEALDRLLGEREFPLKPGEIPSAYPIWVDRRDRETLIERVREQGSVAAYPARMKTRAGVPFDAMVWATMLDVAGEACLAVGLVNVTEQKRQEALILSVARGVADGTGDALFRSLVRGVYDALGGDRVLVGEIVDGEVRTVIVLSDGEPDGNFRYALADSPCEAAMSNPHGTPLVVIDDLAIEFPQAPAALFRGMRGYVGMTLRDSEGTALGVLAVVTRGPVQPTEKLEALFQIFAARAEVELAHLRDQRRIVELNESLEERVKRRTTELEAAVAELESFSYSVSHDLLAPVRSINGYASIVLDEAGARLQPSERAMLQRLIGEADRMGILVEDLLNLSRVGRRALDVRPVDLSRLASEVIDEAHEREPGREVEVHVEPGLEGLGDPGLLRIVLDNLVRNAFKFTAGRQPARIEFGALPHSIFFVRDNGVGFDPAHTNSLFKPFHRLHTDEEFPGTGIGLAIVARVVSRHGGYHCADGKPGEGATFYFTLGPGPEGPPTGGRVL